MISDLPPTSLIVQSFSRLLLVSGAGIAIVGFIYATVFRVASVAAPQSSSNPVDCWLWFPSGPSRLNAAWCRAIALAITAVGVTAGASLIQRYVDDLLNRWDVSHDWQQPWHFGFLALLGWVALLPFALFVWGLPLWTVGRSAQAANAKQMRPARESNGRPHGVATWALQEDVRPHTEPVRRACRRYATGVALCAPTSSDRERASARHLPPLDILLLLPIVALLFLVATVHVWLVAMGIAILAVWVFVVWALAYRSAAEAPGSVIADYLLLASDFTASRRERTERLAAAYLDSSPATRQDHEQLVEVFSNASSIGAVPWSPMSVDAPSIEMSTRLWMTDGRGLAHGINLAFHLRRQGPHWRITREVREATVDQLTASITPRFAVASSWRPR